MRPNDRRRLAAARWVTHPATTTGRHVNDPECAILRAQQLLDLVNQHYQAAKRMLDHDSPELASLAQVVDRVQEHHGRMTRHVLLAREVNSAFPPPRAPD